MKKIIFVSLFFSFVFSTNLVQAQKISHAFKSCGDLYKSWLEHKKMDNGLEFNRYDAAFYQGYVIAHAEAYSNMAANVTGGGKGWPEGILTGQIMLIYGKYLEENPEKHHLSGMSCFHQALMEAFPNSY